MYLRAPQDRNKSSSSHIICQECANPETTQGNIGIQRVPMPYLGLGYKYMGSKSLHPGIRKHVIGTKETSGPVMCMIAVVPHPPRVRTGITGFTFAVKRSSTCDGITVMRIPMEDKPFELLHCVTGPQYSPPGVAGPHVERDMSRNDVKYRHHGHDGAHNRDGLPPAWP